ncbi:hypothetical protein Sgly_2489 [Syntrophobotulus glycolicus DSM 8271]|uniref:DUF92 domain-containing protein n=1 Tax=Syntrophobotulus glycolicus (strain DSM 8271 / FlGlyR) TaxID=645991 RepID=F0SVZ0_SYNGF|nr:hypothetical protein [Syntrophobotulus glycolicus]ADY56774.1 hypothetical protein Sgly_2489 [Syntrophobotulus glycolicus DSM 8271]
MNLPMISLVVFTLMIGSTFLSFFRRKNLKMFLGFVLAYFAFLAFILLEFAYDFRVYDFVVLLVVMTIFMHFFIGKNLGYYVKSRVFDRYLHLFGTCSLCLFAFLVLGNLYQPVFHSQVLIFIFVLSLGALLGVLFELMEFAVDTVFKTKEQDGLADTNFDLLFNTFGSVIAAIIVVSSKTLF